MEKRIVELEKKIAFQEKTIDDLNGEVIEQQKRIDALERIVKQLKQQVSSEGIVKPLADEEPPPHY